MPTSHSRVRLVAAVATAFVCGLLFASGFDLTRFGFAQDGSKGGKVASSQVQSLAETGTERAWGLYLVDTECVADVGAQ